MPNPSHRPAEGQETTISADRLLGQIEGMLAAQWLVNAIAPDAAAKLARAIDVRERLLLGLEIGRGAAS